MVSCLSHCPPTAGQTWAAACEPSMDQFVAVSPAEAQLSGHMKGFAVLVVVLLFLLTYTEPELNWKILSCLFPFLMLWRELWEWELCLWGSQPKHSSKALDVT